MAPPPAMSQAAGLSPPRDLSHHFSQSTKNRGASAVKQLYKFFQIPGVGNLAGGLPNPGLFPYDTLEAQVALPDRWPVEVNKNGSAAAPKHAASHFVIPAKDDQVDLSKKIDLATALQYGTAGGYPPLLSFVRQFIRNHLHPNVPYLDGPEVILTTGATDGFSKAVELIVEPWVAGRDPVEDRPGMLCETYVYMNAPNTALPRGVQVVPVEVDSEGMSVDGPGGLKDVLENWDYSKGRLPHFIYSVTMGHNPTGGLQSIERRKAIYALCCQYDIILIEDEPYWNLQYRVDRDGRTPSQDKAHGLSKSTGYEFLDSLVPSSLNLDTEGRVIRLDTFSKTIAPGCRLGWITAQPAFIERFLRITETSTQQPSGFVQSLVAEAIMGQQPEATTRRFHALSSKDKASFEGWSMDGWVRWLAGLRGVYEGRMAQMSTILDENSFELKQSTPVRDSDTEWGVITKTRLLSFNWPKGGMFIWVRIHFESHPLWQARGEAIGGEAGVLVDGPLLAKALMVFLSQKPYLVLAAPGAMFGATAEIQRERTWKYSRLCFAAEDEDVVGPCATRYATGIHKFWRIKSVAEIKKLVAKLDTESVEQLEQGMGNLGLMAGC
uniref:Aminotransferase class I/classII large domain-containing protein n=1 Tax=Bionectria ochroleuca TaxID=29856 RepID=A0A8H7TQD3_BIOOC